MTLNTMKTKEIIQYSKSSIERKGICMCVCSCVRIIQCPQLLSRPDMTYRAYSATTSQRQRILLLFICSLTYKSQRKHLELTSNQSRVREKINITRIYSLQKERIIKKKNKQKYLLRRLRKRFYRCFRKRLKNLQPRLVKKNSLM